MAVFVFLYQKEKMRCITQEAQGTEETYTKTWFYTKKIVYPVWHDTDVLLNGEMIYFYCSLLCHPYHLSLNTNMQLLVNQTVLFYLNTRRAVSTRNALQLFESRHNYTITVTVMLAVKCWCFILFALIKSDHSFCSANDCDVWVMPCFFLAFCSSLCVKPSHSGVWSKHKSAYVTQAACGLTSVFRLEPYQRGE